MSEKFDFDMDLIKQYPHSLRKISVGVQAYSLSSNVDEFEAKGQTVRISPHGLEFQIPKDFPNGTLLRINVSLPDYWDIKQRFVEYSRVDRPSEFKVLAKVIHSESLSKKGRKRLVIAQTVNIDEIDEMVLKSYLAEAK